MKKNTIIFAALLPVLGAIAGCAPSRYSQTGAIPDDPPIRSTSTSDVVRIGKGLRGPCGQESTAQSCQIDIVVSVDNNQCTVRVFDIAASKANRIRWVIKPFDASGNNVEFADMPNRPPILLDDEKGFAVPHERTGRKKFTIYPTKAHADTHYFIILQWPDGNRLRYCVVDPIINNDDPSDP